MLRIRQDVYLGLSFDRVEFPLEATGFTELKIVSSLDIAVPMIEIQLVDSVNFFTDRVTLADGILLTVQLGVNESERDTFYFRVHKHTERKENGVNQYVITGYLDVVTFFLATANRPVRGTSTDVMKYIAGMSGMSFIGDAASDSQVWIPRNDRYCRWAADVVAHAWAGSMSLMKLGITPAKQMRYRNVMALETSGELPSFVNTDAQPSKRIFQMLDHRNFSKSGNNNSNGGGYGHRLVVQRTTNAFQEVRDKITYKRFSPFLDVSKEVKEQVMGAPGSPGVQHVEFSPIDSGNTHLKYWEAHYQNRRLSRLFSMGVALMTESRTRVELLEPIKYMPHYAPGLTGADPKQQMRGIYVVTAKTIRVQMGNYYEILEAYTNGNNTDPAKTGKQE